MQVWSWVRKIPWRRKWQPTPVFLPGESHGQRSLVGYSLWGLKESDTTEQLSAHTCILTKKFPVGGPQVIWCPAAFLMPHSVPQMHKALIWQIQKRNKTPSDQSYFLSLPLTGFFSWSLSIVLYWILFPVRGSASNPGSQRQKPDSF